MYTKHLIYNHLKKRYLALILILFTGTASGQSNYNKLSLGAGAGGTYTFSDVEKGKFAYALVGNLDFHIVPFITAGLEMQKGTLKGGGNGVGGRDIHGRMFTNSYSAFILNAKFRAGQFTDFNYNNFLNYTKGFYLGTGVGILQNKFTTETRPIDKTNDDGTIYSFPLADDKPNILVPLNVGIDFYFPNSWGDIRYIFNINYQTNFTFGEGLDGYDDTKTIRKELGSAPDMYNFLSIGFKYTFGPKGLTGKSIR